MYHIIVPDADPVIPTATMPTNVFVGSSLDNYERCTVTVYIK